MIRTIFNLVRTSPLVFLDDPAFVIVDRQASDDPGLSMAAARQAVNVKRGFFVGDEELFVDELFKVFFCSIEDANVRRARRIQELTRKISALASNRELPVEMLTREEVRAVFFSDGLGTKQELAELLAERFPEELGTRLPEKRRPWMAEDPRMYMFDAVAQAVAVRMRATMR